MDIDFFDCGFACVFSDNDSFSRLSVTVLPANLFKGCTGIKSFWNGNDVASMGAGCFSGCSSLQKVHLPKKLTSLGADAFLDCKNVKYVYVDDVSAYAGMTAANAFSRPNYASEVGPLFCVYDSDTKKYAQVDTLTLDSATITTAAFSNYAHITSVTLGSKVSNIGKYAFSGCSGLAALTIKGYLSEINAYAFSGCSALATMSFSHMSNIQVGESAFEGCSKIKAGPWMMTLMNIGKYAFNGCSSLDKVLLIDLNYAPLNMKRSIGTGAFDQTVILYGGADVKAYCDAYGNEYHERLYTSTNAVSAFVTRLYSVCLGREPDQMGAAGWIYKLMVGKNTGIQAAYGFIFSKEFQGFNLCNACYIKAMYNAFMGRNADTAGYNSWMKQFDKGKNREEIFNGFALSKEFASICEKAGIEVGSQIAVPEYGTLAKGSCTSCGELDGVTAFVTRLYEICFNRTPDKAGLKGWCTKLWEHTQTGAKVAYGFFFSDEFKNKNYTNEEYVQRLYRAFLGREADSAGLSSWVNQLNNGKSRQAVFNGFTGSEEFKKICNRAGIIAK